MRLLRVLAPAALLAAAMVISGCQDEATESAQRPVFGNGSPDQSRVIARVNGEPITDAMLDLRFEELGKDDQFRFKGEEGRRIFLRQMIDEMLRVRAAEGQKLDHDPVVSRVLISQRRQAMDLALRSHVVDDQEPSIDQVREYFEAHRDQYKRLGTMNAMHVECESREQADKAYEMATVDKRPFAHVAAKYSVNPNTKVNGGDLGWFNREGFIPGVRDSKEFSDAIWGLEVGVNPPVEFEGHWHVVKVVERKYERPQTLEEAYDRVVRDLLPAFQQNLVEIWLRDARAGADVEYFGEFRPGHGKTPKELLERAYYAKDPYQKLDILGLLIDDYPDSEYTDDALFMAGNVALDTWGDKRKSSFFFSELVKRFPDSDYIDDTRYILENMANPDFVNPSSIEDLRRGE